MIIECEVLEGVADLAEEELRRRFAGAVRDLVMGSTALRFRYDGRIDDLLALRTIVAAWTVVSHPVPRPKALLGHQHLTSLLGQVQTARSLWSPGDFSSLRLNAAGRDSSVMQRLATELERETGLVRDPDDGDLVIRIKPGGDGWDSLVRLSPRPLSARGWRVRNLEGALNATIAAAMVELSSPRRGDRVLNLMCGSGTLLIERLLRAGATSAVGIDIDENVLALAAENIAAAELTGRAELRAGDATGLAMAEGSFDRLFVDLPYGHRMGSHEDNEALYPAVLQEASRVATIGARLVAVTHELRRFESAVDASPWRVEQVRQVFQKGHHPKIWVLRRGEGRPRRLS